MDELGEHHSQQADTRTENEIPHVLTPRRVMNNEDTWTQGGEHYTLGSTGGGHRRDSGREGRGEITWGETSGIGDGGMEAINHLAMNVPMQQSCMICTCIPESTVKLKKNKLST